MAAGLATDLGNEAELAKEDQLEEVYGPSWKSVHQGRDQRQRGIGR